MPRVARKPMELTAENVRNVIIDCLWTKEEVDGISEEILTNASIEAEGITRTFYFNPEKIQLHKKDIRDFCESLPEEFMQNSDAGGHSFLNACMTRDGKQWGEQRSVENLLCLGLASGDIVFLIKERKLWQLLPGGVPYFYVTQEYKAK